MNLATLKLHEKYLKNFSKFPFEIQDNIYNITNEVIKRPFKDAMAYLTRPSIGGRRPRVGNINLPQGLDYYHFYANGSLNEYRVLYLVDSNKESIEFIKIVEPKDHGYISEVAIQEYKASKNISNHYIYDQSPLNFNVDVRKQKRYFDIDGDQIDIINKLESSYGQSFFILGGAGSGKTITAIELFKRISLRDSNTVYLTFTENLLKDTKEKLIMTGFSANECYTFNQFFMEKSNSKSKEYHLNLIDECILKYIQLETSNQDALLKYPSFFDKNFLYSLIRGFFLGGLNPKNKYLKYDYEDETTFNRLINILQIKNLELNEQDLIIKTIKEIILDYLRLKNTLNLNDDNDFLINQSLVRKTFIVDEVQDLTEYQIASIIKCCPEQNLYFFGDPQQVINPTFFEVERIRQMLQGLGVKKPEVLHLTKNYRNTNELIKYSDYLTKIRKETFKKSDFNETAASKFKDSNKTNKVNPHSIVRLHDKSLTQLLFKNLNHATDVTIIVSDQKQKIDFIKKYKLDDESIKKFIFTIQEYKGLENSNIIIYNMLFENHTMMIEILKKNFNNSKFNEETFNKFYVAITRSTKSIIICETEAISPIVTDSLYKIPYNLDKNLFKSIDEILTSDEFLNYIDFSNDFNSYIEVAEKYQKNDKYIQAIEKYIHSISLLKKVAEEKKHVKYQEFIKANSKIQELEQTIDVLISEIIKNPKKFLDNDPLDVYLTEVFEEILNHNLPNLSIRYAQLLEDGTYVIQNINQAIKLYEEIFLYGSFLSLSKLNYYLKENSEYVDLISENTILKMAHVYMTLNIGENSIIKGFISPTLDIRSQFKIVRQYNSHIRFYEISKLNNQEIEDKELLFEIGHHYLNDNNIKEAYKCFENAASKGHPESIYLTGISYLEGKNGIHDLKKAIYFLEIGFDKKSEKCSLELGKIYLNKDTSFTNFERAFICLDRASNLGSLDAKLELASMYENGIGVQKDNVKSYDLNVYLKEQGFPASESKLKNPDYLFNYANSLYNQNRSYYTILKAFEIYKSLVLIDHQPSIDKIQDETFMELVFESLYFYAKNYEFICQVFETYLPNTLNIKILHIVILSHQRVGRVKNSFNLLVKIQNQLRESNQNSIIGIVKAVREDGYAVIGILEQEFGFNKDQMLFLKSVEYKLSDSFELFPKDVVIISDFFNYDVRNLLIGNSPVIVNEVLKISRLKKSY